MKSLLRAAVAAAGLAIAMPSLAHVDLMVTGDGGPGSTNLFGFGPTHSCGQQPTSGMRIQIPPGIESVKPVGKPGWQIEIVEDANGAVAEIRFSGGEMPADWFEQFWLRARISPDAAPGTTIYFPLIQECTADLIRWISIPVAGQTAPDEIAPGFTVGGTTGAAAR